MSTTKKDWDLSQKIKLHGTGTKRVRIHGKPTRDLNGKIIHEACKHPYFSFDYENRKTIRQQRGKFRFKYNRIEVAPSYRIDPTIRNQHKHMKSLHNGE